MKRLVSLVASFSTALLIFAGDLARAQDSEPFAEISISPEEVSVGEPITMRVSIFVPTWFAKPPTFPTFEIPNAITRLPPDSSRPTSRRVGSETWSGITRAYQVYPLLGARFRMENQNIDVQYANPGKAPIRVNVPTGEIAFSAVVPEGAESLNPYVAGERLELSREIEGDVESLAVGDAIVVTYTAELEGLSAIFLPELVVPTDIAGVSVYPDQPVVEDGDIAKRIERVTYIFNAGGDFEIPAVSIDWWNRDSSRIESVTSAAMSFSVEGPALESDPGAQPATERNWWPVVIAIIAFLLILPRLRRRIARFQSNRREQERLHRASETYAWQRARKTMRSGDEHRSYDEIVRWLGKLDPALDSRSFAASFGDEKLVTELAKLNRVLYAESGDSVDLAGIAHGLGIARERCLTERQESLEVALPPLNP